ncbi:MAG: hypothetical protein K6T99_01655 [Armatimonadetes bacterium]|nr:hypothetical protein [Armatimonadota bacterium]
MSLRTVFACTALIVLTMVSPLFPAEEMLSSLPVYPGGKVDFELNIAEDDFLPAFRHLLLAVPIFAGKMATSFPTSEAAKDGVPGTHPVDPKTYMRISSEIAKELQAATTGLKQFSVVTYRIDNAVKREQVANFYMQKLGLTKGWRSIMRVDSPLCMCRIYAKPGIEGIFVLIVQFDRIIASRTSGKIDFVAISRTLEKYLPAISEQMTNLKLPPQPEQPASVPGQSDKDSKNGGQAE